MGFRAFSKKLKVGIDQLAKSQSEDALKAAFAGNALMKLRIQERGLNYQGQSFPDYSDQYLTYKTEVLGRPVSHVDFTVSGELMNSVFPRVASTKFGTVEVVIASKGRKNEQKLSGFLDKYGNILLFSKEEGREVFRIYAINRFNRVRNIFK